MRHQGKMFSSQAKEMKWNHILTLYWWEFGQSRRFGHAQSRTPEIPLEKHVRMSSSSSAEWWLYSAMLCNICIEVSVLFCVSRCSCPATFILKLLRPKQNIERVDGIHSKIMNVNRTSNFAYFASQTNFEWRGRGGGGEDSSVGLRQIDKSNMNCSTRSIAIAME